MIENEEINRMRWAARRGMLELDLVLEPFVTSRYALMLCEDQDLFTWFMQRNQPSDPELAGIVKQILLFAQSAPKNR